MVDDEIALSQRLRAAHAGALLVLLGHNLGSFIAQDVVGCRADLLSALVLSGTSYPPPGELIAVLDEAACREL